MKFQVYTYTLLCFKLHIHSLKLALWARKFSEAFEKRAPGLKKGIEFLVRA